MHGLHCFYVFLFTFSITLPIAVHVQSLLYLISVSNQMAQQRIIPKHMTLGRNISHWHLWVVQESSPSFTYTQRERHSQTVYFCDCLTYEAETTNTNINCECMHQEYQVAFHFLIFYTRTFIFNQTSFLCVSSGCHPPTEYIWM